MINVIYQIPNIYDAVSFYRGLGPFQHLRTIMPVTFTEIEHFNWTTIGMADIVYMIRPSTKQHVDLFYMAKDMGKMVIVDYDDDVLSLPKYNQARAYFEQDDIKTSIQELLRNADAVIASTEFLARKLQYLRLGRRQIDVINNAFPDHMLNIDTHRHTRSKVITWRGSLTHECDLEIMEETLIKFQETYPGFYIVFLGEPHWKIISKLDGGWIKVLPPIDTFKYFDMFRTQFSQMNFVPLVDNDFNRSKSNIAWLEASYAGAVTMAKAFDEWVKPGIVNDVTMQAFELLNYPMELDLRVAASRNHIKEYYLLSKINLKRKELIESLT